MKSRLIAGDLDGRATDARWALEAGAAESESSDRPLRGRSRLPRARRGRSRQRSSRATLRGAKTLPAAVTDALAALCDVAIAAGYASAIRALLADFEAREEFLEDVPVADTVLALQSLAAPRGLAVELRSTMLPT